MDIDKNQGPRLTVARPVGRIVGRIEAPRHRFHSTCEWDRWLFSFIVRE